MDEKTVEIKFNHKTFLVSATAISGLRAAHYAAKDFIDGVAENYMDVFTSELEYGLSDLSELNDWMANNMDWKEIAIYFDKSVKILDAWDYEDDWNAGNYIMRFQ